MKFTKLVAKTTITGIDKDSNKPVIEVTLSRIDDEVALFNNLVSESEFMKNVQLFADYITYNSADAKLQAFTQKWLQNEPLTDAEYMEKASRTAIKNELEKLDFSGVETVPTLAKAVAQKELKGGYALPVSKLDKLIRDYWAGMVDETTGVAKAERDTKKLTEIKREMRHILSIFDTEKDGMFKKWACNVNDKMALQLIAWNYKGCEKTKNGYFKPTFVTGDGDKPKYKPLQMELLGMLFNRLQYQK